MLLLLLPLFIIMQACDKKNNPDPEPETPETPEDPTPPVTPKPAKIYYVGYKYPTSFKETTKHAILRINDSLVNLSSTLISDAVDVYPLNNDVHITGYQQDKAGNRKVAYWKNNKVTLYGTAANISTGTAIFATGNKVYVAGMQQEATGVGNYRWVNGVKERAGCCLSHTRINAMAEGNGSVVSAGQFALTAAMWVGGSIISLANATSNSYFIKTINKDIYVLGYRNQKSGTDVAAVWKNDQEIFVLPHGQNILSLAATMVGQDYYFVINSYDGSRGNATVYKNKTLLYKLSPTKNLEAKAIQVHEGKVYVLGNYYNGTKSSAVLWTNGQPKVLYDESKKIHLNDMVIK